MQTNYKLPNQVIEKGEELGYAPAKLPLLFLIPFVKIAWSEGFVQAAEQKAILRFAENFQVDQKHTDFDLLLGWFNERPTDEFLDNSIEDLRELLEQIPPKQAARLRSMLQFGCIEVAHAAGDIGLFRNNSNIRREERENILHISEKLGLSPSYVN